MNKRYVLAGEEVFVYDENADKTEGTNKDGIEKVLEQENIVEEIQSQINSVNDKISDIHIISNVGKSFKKRSILTLGMTGLVVVSLASLFSLLALFLGGLVALISKNSITPILELISSSFSYALKLWIPAGLGILLIDQIEVKGRSKELNALQSQLEYLKQMEKDEIAKLEQMKQELASKPVIKVDFSVDKELNLEQLKQFRDQLEQELGSIYDKNYKKPEQDKQKVLG